MMMMMMLERSSMGWRERNIRYTILASIVFDSYKQCKHNSNVQWQVSGMGWSSSVISMSDSRAGRLVQIASLSTYPPSRLFSSSYSPVRVCKPNPAHCRW